MNTEKRCQYCENLELKPNYPQKGCDYFSRQNEEDIALAFQLGMAFGFAKRYDEMDKIIEEIRKAVMPQKDRPC